MRILIVIYLFFLGLLALLAEMILPSHFHILGAIGFGSALIPLLVIYASLHLGDERAPILAGVLGLLLDLNTQHHLGVSILILSSLSTLIITQAHRSESRLWIVRLTFVLVGTFAYEMMDYLFSLIQVGRWYWPLEVWSKITFASLLNLLLTPVMFFIGDLPFRLLGWEEESGLPERNYAR